MNNIAIFASGSGSNAENIINYFINNQIPSGFIIFSENPKAFVFERAKELGVDAELFSMNELRSGLVLSKLKKSNINFIILAGFLKLIPAEIIKEYNNRIVNIHPALLPKYGGKGMFGEKVHSAVINARERESGITIHYVNNNYDEGDIIFQAKCEVSPEDTPESLAEKIHQLEYKYFPEVVYGLLK